MAHPYADYQSGRRPVVGHFDSEQTILSGGLGTRTSRPPHICWRSTEGARDARGPRLALERGPKSKWPTSRRPDAVSEARATRPPGDSFLRRRGARMSRLSIVPWCAAPRWIGDDDVC